jgi:ABC-type multidrug transport system ATPase subunit
LPFWKQISLHQRRHKNTDNSQFVHYRLGANGAGKTTTLGMLTGDIAPSGGEAYVAGHDITGVAPGGVQEARKNIGFCPQIDP